MKKVLAVALLFLGAVPLWAQTTQKSSLLFYNYDLTSTSYIFCKYTDRSGDPWQVGGGYPSPANVVTSGSSTTVAALTASTNPFAEVAVGDLLIFRISSTGTTYQRLVTARASADSITVDAAIDLGTAGVPFSFYKRSCGTAATDGWLDVSKFYALDMARNITTINATSIDFQVQCKLNSVGTATVVSTTNATGTGAAYVVVPPAVWDACRLGMKINTDTGAQSITASLAMTSITNYPVAPSSTGLYSNSVVVTPTQAAALTASAATTSVTLVPPVTGKAIVPEWLAVVKTAGTAYTISTDADLTACTVAGGLWGNIETVGLVDQAMESKSYRHYAIAASGTNITTAVGEPLNLCVDAGSLANGSDLTVTVGYRLE